ncbi:hypothetical protein CP966_27090 [Streptomyces galilaeus]|jgi:hypothetical protein|nr:hypothetical protein [Streptomyces galilaeus]QEU68517.1 hypothetical protein CP966_27090 [Streptomyces galilaeus]GGW22995.1 hypothetical protein GCM10010350_00500 [Streptomyces galilaeus]
MGVMARLFRRSKATQEAAGDATVTEETVTQDTAAQETTATTGTSAGSPAGGTEAEESAEDGVGIPRQQSSGEAAESEAGDSART